jgi:transposase-like protein
MGEFIIDGTVVKVGSEVDWMWIAIEPKNKEIVLLYYQGGNMSLAGGFIVGLVKTYGEHQFLQMLVLGIYSLTGS